VVLFIEKKLERKSKKGDATIMVIVALFLGILIFVVMVGFVFKIPGLGGQYLGFIANALTFTISTIWDLLGRIIAPLIKEIQEAALWSALTIGITVPILFAMRAVLAHGIKLTAGQAIRSLFRLSFWKGLASEIKMGISHWWGGVKEAFSVGIRNGFKYLTKSLITNGWKIAAGFAVGMAVEIGVTFGLDYLSYKLVGKGFAQAINDALPGGGVYRIGPASFSVGSATQSAISGAISGAVVGAMFGGPIGAAVGAVIGGIVGFFTGGFFH